MEIYTTSQAKNHLLRLVNHTAESHEPVYIVGKKHKAVLISEEDYSSIIETQYLNSIPGMKDSIIAESKQPIENFSDTLEWDDE